MAKKEKETVHTGSQIKESLGSRIFDGFNVLLLAGVGILCLVPFLYVFAASVSPLEDIITRRFFIIPHSLDFTAYKYLLGSKSLVRSIGTSVFITVVGTLLSMTVTVMMSYVLTKPIMGRKVINTMVVFTMLFSGGMIPSYLVVSGLKLTNTFWALWLPGCVSAYNMILIRTTIKALPHELEEAATVDGCNYFQCFYKIILPLIKPTLATFALFYAVGYWNDYFQATLYISDSTKWPIQVWLRQIVVLSSGLADITETGSNIPAQSIKFSVIIFATVPILCVYPFIQRFFTKGMMVGSVKG